MRKQNRRQTPRKTRVLPKYVSPASIEYTGPLTRMDHDSTIITLFDNASISSNGTGEISGQFGNNPSNARNWTEMSTSWAEYRVLGIKYTYMPKYSANTTTLSGFSGYHSVVHGSPTVPASLAQGASTGDARIWNPFRPFVREWRMSEVDEAALQLTSTPSQNSFSMYLYATDATVSTLYGNIIIEYVVQFRTHNL